LADDRFPKGALFGHRLGELAKQVAPNIPIRLLSFHPVFFTIPHNYQVTGWGNVYVLAKISCRQKIVVLHRHSHHMYPKSVS
jgi:hypothetical protein